MCEREVIVVCQEPKSSVPVRVPLGAVAAVVAAAGCVWVAAEVVPFLPAVTLSIMAVNVAAMVALRHLLLYGRARKPRRVRVAVRPVERRALKAPARAIEGTVVGATVLSRDGRQAVR